MGKIVTGLIAVSLMTTPAGEAAFCARGSEPEKAIFSSLRGNDRDDCTSDNIDKMLYKLEKNSKHITKLMRYKVNAVSKIQTELNQKAITKEPLSEDQIAVYRSFKDNYEEQSTELLEIMETIGKADKMKDVQRAILSDDSESAYNGLKTVSDYQTRAIISLNEILSSCAVTLSCLR